MSGIQALAAWEKELTASQVNFAKVTRWSTIDDHALKWVQEYASYTTKEERQTGHGPDSDQTSEQELPYMEVLKGGFAHAREEEVFSIVISLE